MEILKGIVGNKLYFNNTNRFSRKSKSSFLPEMYLKKINKHLENKSPLIDGTLFDAAEDQKAAA